LKGTEIYFAVSRVVAAREVSAVDFDIEPTASAGSPTTPAAMKMFGDGSGSYPSGGSNRGREAFPFVPGDGPPAGA